MPKQNTGTETKPDEFSKIFDEYRAKIEEITRRTEKNLRSLDVAPEDNADEESEHIEVVNAPPQPEAVVEEPVPEQKEPEPPPPPPEPARRPAEVNDQRQGGRPAFEESAEILQEARREARKIIEEAEESAKKEAKKRTQSQVDKFISKAKKEAEEIVSRANQDAVKFRDEVISESKREADYIIREITQKYRQETEAQSSRTLAEAQEKAGKMLADISDSTQQIGQFITEIATRAKKTIHELETSLQAEAAELTRIIAETQLKLEEVGKTAAREEKEVTPPSSLKEEIETRGNPTLVVRLIGEKSNGKNGTSVMFSGQMEMKSVSASFDYQYLKQLKKYLVHIPNIKYLQEYASEKEMSVVFDILEPLPLLDILSNIPMVDEVVTRADDDICLVFKTDA